MRARSLTLTLALIFAAITLVVFALVGSDLYLALSRQIKQQDDLDIVLAARHTRRRPPSWRNSGTKTGCRKLASAGVSPHG